MKSLCHARYHLVSGSIAPQAHVSSQNMSKLSNSCKLFLRTSVCTMMMNNLLRLSGAPKAHLGSFRIFRTWWLGHRTHMYTCDILHPLASILILNAKSLMLPSIGLTHFTITLYLKYNHCHALGMKVGHWHSHLFWTRYPGMLRWIKATILVACFLKPMTFSNMAILVDSDFAEHSPGWDYRN